MFTTFLFDFDYTLIDATEPIVLSVNHALREYGFPECSYDAILDLVGLTIEDIYIRLAGTEDMETVKNLCHAFHVKADEIMPGMTFYLPGAQKILEDLKSAGFNTGIVTSKRKIMVEDFLKLQKGKNCVDFILGCDSVPCPKPAPDGIFQSAKHFGAELSDILYVGDSVTDCRTAKNAGVAFAGVTTGRTKKETLEQYPHVGIFSSMDSLNRFIFGK